jgi:hypothetical protein
MKESTPFNWYDFSAWSSTVPALDLAFEPFDRHVRDGMEGPATNNRDRRIDVVGQSVVFGR